MGYDVHITRKENCFDKDGPKIDIGEWRALILFDLDMRLGGYASAVVGAGHVLRGESEGVAVRAAHAGTGGGRNTAWFDLRQRNVVVKNSDDAILGKMWELAQGLGVKVQGDECEVYAADGSVIG